MIRKIISLFYGKKENNTKMSFKEGFDLTEMPIVTFQCGDRKLNFLLDTGSNNSVIDSNVLDSIPYEKREGSSSLFGLEGQVVTVSVCYIKLSYKGKDYGYDYLIKDMSQPFGQIKKECGVTLHGLLGSNFFNEFRYVLDFDSLTAYSKQ